MKISRRKLRRIITESILKEQSQQRMEQPALEKIKELINIEGSDANDLFRVDTGRLHGSIGPTHEYSEANAVLNTVNKKFGTDFSIVRKAAKGNMFTSLGFGQPNAGEFLFLVSGGATEVTQK